MSIEAISPITTLQAGQVTKNHTDNVNKNVFGDILKNSIDIINDNLNLTNDMASNIVEGNDGNIQDYIISAQKTEMSIQLTLQVRNQVINAYKEIMKMQV